MTESDVTVTTPDGSADCYFVHPAELTVRRRVFSGRTSSGLRPAFRQMGKRLAESGYSVLVVNPFYRVKATADAGVRNSDPAVDASRAIVERDDANDGCHKAFIGWLDQQSSVARTGRSGTQGYCMGGPIRFAPQPPFPITSEQSPPSLAADW